MQHGMAGRDEACLEERQERNGAGRCSELVLIERTMGTARRTVSAAVAAEVRSILDQKPCFMVCRYVSRGAGRAYVERKIWYFDREEQLIGGTAIFIFADGRVESLWWDRQGKRPAVFDYYEPLPIVLPG